MLPVLTPEEMAEADRRTIAAGTPVEVLMERAGRAVAWAVRRTCGGVYGRRVVVVCGKGNNGGDGLVAARVLRGWGMHVDVFELEAGIDQNRFPRAIDHADCVVDAMYGTGFKGELGGDAAWVVDVVDRCDADTLSIDIPSGVDGLTGEVRGEAFWANETVCFAALKPGHLFQPGRAYSGTVTVADIGVDIGVDRWSTPLGVIEFDGWWCIPTRAVDGHKWSAGAVMVVGGSRGMTGAPLMTSRAAMRSGAGIVWCCLPGEPAPTSVGGTEVITKQLGDLADALTDVERFGALVVGPGLGGDDRVVAGVRELVAKAPVPVVLDADGLNALRGELEPLRAREPATVLTPHAGEYERLAGRPVGEDRLAAARELAERSQSVVLLKGPGEVVAAPGGPTGINATGGPWLATAGTGDVLSGIVGAFLARGASAFNAAAAGAWVHGRAADHAGHTGLIAGDLIEALPRTLQELED